MRRRASGRTAGRRRSPRHAPPQRQHRAMQTDMDSDSDELPAGTPPGAQVHLLSLPHCQCCTLPSMHARHLCADAFVAGRSAGAIRPEDHAEHAAGRGRRKPVGRLSARHARSGRSGASAACGIRLWAAVRRAA